MKYFDNKAGSLIEAAKKIKEKTIEVEGNAFTKALMAARDNKDKFFSVNGKQYRTEDLDKLDVDKVKDVIKALKGATKAHKGQADSLQKALTDDNTNDKSDDGDGLDKVQPKAVKKKFDDRKDKDIDNDGDVDDSDKFLHKRRKAIGKAMDDEEEAPKKKKKVVGNDGEKKAEISKIGEATDELLNMIETAAKQQKSNATKPEEIMDKESPKSKEFANAHKKSDKKIEDNEEDGHDKTFKAGQATKAKSGKRPQDNPAGDTQVVKSTEAPVKGVKEDIDTDAKEGSISLVDMARDILSGKTMSELRQELKQDDTKNPYDGRLKTAKGFLERMNKRRGYEKKDEK